MGAKYIFMDAGMEPDVLLVEVLSGVSFVISSSILHIAECSSSLLVLGGNDTDPKLAEMFGRLGGAVSVELSKTALIARGIDPAVGTLSMDNDTKCR